MLNFIDKFLQFFECCFSRKSAFKWFVTIIIGLMLCSDKLDLTSIIRDLALRRFDYTKRMDRLTEKRNQKIEDYLHKASHKVIEYCKKHDVSKMII